jgi:hypothetical protein
LEESSKGGSHAARFGGGLEAEEQPAIAMTAMAKTQTPLSRRYSMR